MGRGVNRVYYAVHFIYKAIVDFVYPPHCALCDKYLQENEEILCTPCFRTLPLLDDPDMHASALEPQLGVMPHFERSLALYPYPESVEKLVHLFKYKGFTKLGDKLGRELGQMVLDFGYEKDIDAILPVPLHRRRRRERGYNQARILANAASEVCGIPVLHNVLFRTRYTKPQAKMNRQERALNLKGAFSITENADLKERCVALVDDVLTTGNTAHECSKVLMDANVGRIIALTLVRVK